MARLRWTRASPPRGSDGAVGAHPDRFAALARGGWSIPRRQSERTSRRGLRQSQLRPPWGSVAWIRNCGPPSSGAGPRWSWYPQGWGRTAVVPLPPTDLPWGNGLSLRTVPNGNRWYGSAKACRSRPGPVGRVGSPSQSGGVLGARANHRRYPSLGVRSRAKPGDPGPPSTSGAVSLSRRALGAPRILQAGRTQRGRSARPDTAHRIQHEKFQLY